MKVSLSDLLQSVRIAKTDTAFIELAADAGARLTSVRNAFLHLVVEGEAFVDAGGTGKVERLGPGDYLTSLGTRPQIVMTARDARITASDYFVATHTHDSPPTIRFGRGRCVARLLSGAFHLPVVNPLVRALPRHMIVRKADAEGRSLLDVDIASLARSAIGPGATTLLTSTLDVLFMQAVRSEVAALFKDGLQIAGGVDRFRIPIALSLVHSHPDRRWTLARLANEVGVSRSTLAAEFSAVVGEPLMQYVTRLRMTRAADMLRWQPVAVADVAWNVGYESVSSFTRAFRNFFGVTPAAYQRAQAPRYAEAISGHMHWTPFLGDDD
ncbi:helix-turn-helix transcriptional regulator [Sphingomonas sp. KC8]|uniref:helix-turn-helix transcriptional regulator n=1 Tax=Sphingomonas sp. KC8 TaxID=1030157 RepID=UPI000248A3A9|nr:AraC family transcriptional regulator [Sphingomonas sp. KC8]ARS29497.1 putative AraC family transcriptional regulator [Sphingomonas sp. KC8]